jgi:hypothetical protein
LSNNRALGERLVAAAAPRFKDFRVDFEKISNGAGRLMERGEITLEERKAMFHDVGWDIRIPLQRRYAEEGALDAVAHYHAKRFKLLLGRNTLWPDEPGWDALRLFAAHGRADIGIDLVRSYVDMQNKRLKRDYSTRNPRGPRKDLPEGTKQLMGTIGSVIAAAIPDRKAELFKAMDSLAGYIEEHGSADDHAWFDGVRREIWMEKRA